MDVLVWRHNGRTYFEPKSPAGFAVFKWHFKIATFPHDVFTEDEEDIFKILKESEIVIGE